MRNLLNSIGKFWKLWSVRVDGMIHPLAAADTFQAPLHRSFLIGCLISGSTALVILPLHLAFAGAPHAATTLVLAWMLSQWPLANYLSRSGALNRAIGISSTLFASFVAAFCLVTGGSNSFALLWLLVPPIEAALSTNRKIAAGVSALCLALLGGLFLFSANVPYGGVLPPEAQVLMTLGALIYVGLLAVRISSDRDHALRVIKSSVQRQETACGSVSDALFELSQTGRLSTIGGPIGKYFGVVPKESDEDWLFHRLHVADRPLYLTQLAFARVGECVPSFPVRLRVGAAEPGEAGRARFQRFEMRLKPVAGNEQRTHSGTIVLTLSEREDNGIQTVAPTLANLQSALSNAYGSALEEAVDTVRSEASDVVDLTARVESRDDVLSEGCFDRMERQLEEVGQAGADSLNAILDLAPDARTGTETDYGRVDIAACLDHSCNLMRPLADRLGVGIELEASADLPEALLDRKKFRQSVHLLLSDLVESVGAGAVVHVRASQQSQGLQVKVTVSNRMSNPGRNAEGLNLVLERAATLLAETSAHLETRSEPGSGESIIIQVPVRASRPEHPPVPDETNKPLAKTA